MDQIQTGKFIGDCRKEKGLTQVQLAEKLGVTDRAVSKWECGKSMPDASLMLPLCGILGITVNELLSGERIQTENAGKQADKNLIALKRAGERSRKWNRILAVVFSAALLIGAVVCWICDLAITGRVTWSLIPISSTAFAWVISFPGILWGKKGLWAGLVSLTIFIFPYLYFLSVITNARGVFTIGMAMASVTVAFLWLAAVLFMRIAKTKQLLAWGVSCCLLPIPFLLLVNGILSKLIEEPLWDIWDALVVLILLAMFAFFAVSEQVRQKREKP